MLPERAPGGADPGTPGYTLVRAVDAATRYDYRHRRPGKPTPAKKHRMRPLMVLNLVQPRVRAFNSYASAGIRRRRLWRVGADRSGDRGAYGNHPNPMAEIPSQRYAVLPAGADCRYPGECASLPARRRHDLLRRIGYTGTNEARARRRRHIVSGGIGQLLVSGPLLLAVPVAPPPGRPRGPASAPPRLAALLLLQVLGGLTILLGLLFAGVFDQFPLAGRMLRPSARPRAGLAGAPLLGVMFGLGWTPCVGPTLAAVLSLALTTGSAARGAFLAFLYGLGIGIPFLIVAALFQQGARKFAFARRHARLVTQFGGALLVIVGVLQVSGAWGTAMTWLKVHWVSGYQPPL